VSLLILTEVRFVRAGLVLAAGFCKAWFFSVSTPVRDSTVRYTYKRVLWLYGAFVAAVRLVFSHRIVALRRTLRWLSSVLGLRCGLGSA
jgi:hypothetical protein